MAKADLRPCEDRIPPPTAKELDAALCYRALASRDARFDGKFFTGVRTTGVYCRPVCPARTPKRSNVAFYRCAAEAEAAGYRPCLRCRPEASPGTPAWLGTSATVSRALRMIAAGALDHRSVEQLATRLGIGERHLRRLFIEHLGVSPIAVAQTHRVHFAKQLLDETDLAIVRVALDAGFASVRRFNAAVKATYGRSPRELRATGRSGDGRSNDTQRRLSLRLAYRPPLAWRLLLDFFSSRAIAGIEQVDGEAYHRLIVDGDQVGIVSVRREPSCNHLRLEVPSNLSPALVGIVDRVRRVFDLGAEPSEIRKVLVRDPLLSPKVRAHPGLRVPGAWDGFEIAVRAVVGQQVSVPAATTVLGRIAARFGRAVSSGDPELCQLFPSADVLAEAALETVGMPRSRAQTVRVLAREVARGALRLDAGADANETFVHLTALPGIGPWTASYVVMRALADPDTYPIGDLGLQRALAAADQSLRGANALAERAQRWRPWRAYGAVYLWMTSGRPRKETIHDGKALTA